MPALHRCIQSKAAPVVRPADIRGLVIRIGTYTNRDTHSVKRPAHTYTHTHECADVFAQSIFAQTSAHKYGRIKDENEPHKKQDIGSSCEK